MEPRLEDIGRERAGLTDGQIVSCFDGCDRLTGRYHINGILIVVLDFFNQSGLVTHTKQKNHH